MKVKEKLCLTYEEVVQIISWIGYKSEDEPLWNKLRAFDNKYDPIRLKQEEFIRNKFKKNGKRK